MKTNAQTEEKVTATTCFKKKYWIAVEQAVGAVGIEWLVGENSQHDDAEEAAYTVNSPNIQRVIPLKFVLHLDSVVANYSGH